MLCKRDARYRRIARKTPVISVSSAWKCQSPGVYFQQAGNAAYGAAKGGIIGLSQSLAKELYADDIRVNCIGSGLLRKPLAEGAVKPVTGLARTGRPEDIAYATLYLVSDEAGWVTGQVLNVDGGVDVGTRPLWKYER